MHDNEFPIDLALATSLVRSRLALGDDLEISAVSSHGTDNAIFRVGETMVARFPRIESASRNIQREWEWIGRLSGRLALATPSPVVLGEPTANFPWPWMVNSWIDGDSAPNDGPGLDDAAEALGEFIRSIHTIEAVDRPMSPRGGTLEGRDDATRRALAKCTRWIDVPTAMADWERALEATSQADEEVLIHGDLAPGNLILRAHRLVGVIDFSTITVGDPACDLMVAWNLLGQLGRRTLRRDLAVDDATWQRGRGWSLSVAALQLPYYATRNRSLAANSRRVFAELASDPA